MIVKGYFDISDESNDCNCGIELSGHPDVVKEALKRIRKHSCVKLVDIEGIQLED